MRITTLIENTSCGDSFASEHGISLLIETGKHKILFDAGQSDAFARHAEKLGVDMVPVVEEMTGAEFKEKYPDAETLLARVEGNDSGIYKGQQEGWVIRPTVPVYSEVIGGDLSFKVINNKYLLKNS